MGFLGHPVNVGIFPPSDQRVPDDLRRPLDTYGEQCVNYASLEESPYAHEVLGALVEQGFVEKLDSVDGVKATLSGVMPVTSKMALITTLKDGRLNTWPYQKLPGERR